MNTERLIVAKFGGSSNANANSIALVRSIIEANPSRRVIVPSAFGRDEDHLDKATDLLLGKRFLEFEERMHQIGRDSGWKQRDLVMAEIMADIHSKPFRDFRASRGEYAMGRMLADLTGFRFLDAAGLIKVRMGSQGARIVDESSYQAINEKVGNAEGGVVIPGFYGSDRKGWIRTLPRDGSDISGAVVARALRAEVYEIFSDTAVRTTDPRLSPEAEVIHEMTYEELTKLTESGAKIVHPQVAEILRGTGVSINCRNTFAAEQLGTWIRG